MQKTLPVFLAILGLCAAAVAQDTAAKKPAFVPTATPGTTAADDASEKKSPGVLQILFGSRHPRPPGPAQPAPKAVAITPAPAPPKPAAPKPHAKPAPKPKAKKIAKADPASSDDASVQSKKPKPKARPDEPAPTAAKPEATEAVKPAPEKTEMPAPEAVAPIKKPRKGKGTPGTAAKEGVEPPPDADPETKEKFRFDQVKAKASEDAEVMELKVKADGAVSDEDARSAQRAYNKALYNKMRKIDGTLDERINAMEAAVLKRLDAK